MREEELAARLDALEARIARLEAAPRTAQGRTAAAAVHDAGTPPPIITSVTHLDAAVVGKCILIVGGAYVLRALTELKMLPNGVGVGLGFGYALFWIWWSRNVFHAATGAMIAGVLSWEAATRFHIIGAAGGGVLIAIAALVLLWIANRRSMPVYAAMAGGLAIIASIGVALGTADALPAALTVAAIGVVISLQRRWDIFLTAGIAAANDSIAITLIALTIFERSPHDLDVVQGALFAMAAAWLVAPVGSRLLGRDQWLRWPEIAQAIAATVIGLGGAAFLALVRGGDPTAAAIAAVTIAVICYALALRPTARTDAAAALTIAGAIAAAIAMAILFTGPVLSIFWSVAAVLSAGVGRRIGWPLLFIQAAFWAIGGLVLGLGSILALSVSAALAVLSLAFIPAAQMRYPRLALLAVAAVASLVTVMRIAPPASRSTTAFEWTALLAIAIAALSLLAGRIAEASILARALLIVAGVKVVVDDLRVGQATSLVASLALYGGAMLLFARRRRHTEA